MNNNEKLLKFTQAIRDYAREQSEEIQREVDRFRTERLGTVEQEVLKESQRLTQKEQDELRRSISRERSEHESAARSDLFETRREMENRIFERARQKLLDMTATADYADRLKASLTEMANRLPAEGTVYRLAERDMIHEDTLKAVLPAGSLLEPSQDIQIGGIRAENLGVGILLDDTWDTCLAEQREWFAAHSGLSIE